MDAIVERVDRIDLGGNAIGRGIPKLTLDVVLRKDVILVNLSKQAAVDRVQWKKRIHVADPNLLGHKTWFGLAFCS
ncbi:hypothetical protein QKW61_013705, partial [Staphylococcus nepalensis]|nr:hypothetical protein [Staphylococcus nepalensis]